MRPEPFFPGIKEFVNVLSVLWDFFQLINTTLEEILFAYSETIVVFKRGNVIAEKVWKVGLYRPRVLYAIILQI